MFRVLGGIEVDDCHTSEEVLLTIEELFEEGFDVRNIHVTKLKHDPLVDPLNRSDFENYGPPDSETAY